MVWYQRGGRPLCNIWWQRPGPWFNIKMTSCHYRKSYCGDKTVVRSSYLHNGISYTGKTVSVYWIGALMFTSRGINIVGVEAEYYFLLVKFTQIAIIFYEIVCYPCWIISSDQLLSSLTRWLLGDMDSSLNVLFRSCFTDCYLQIFLWLFPQMNVSGLLISRYWFR